MLEFFDLLDLLDLIELMELELSEPKVACRSPRWLF